MADLNIYFLFYCQLSEKSPKSESVVISVIFVLRGVLTKILSFMRYFMLKFRRRVSSGYLKVNCFVCDTVRLNLSRKSC